jgi:hypothetical protein
MLWCLLGDATDDPLCYEKAWELSGHKSGRAQRHWALYYFNRKEVVHILNYVCIYTVLGIEMLVNPSTYLGYAHYMLLF